MDATARRVGRRQKSTPKRHPSFSPLPSILIVQDLALAVSSFVTTVRMPSTLPSAGPDEADAVDEFFGDDDAIDRRGLAAAEDRALAARFRNVGYHETYEESQEERLQEGFEVGYTQAFAVAREIGTRLGRSVLQGQWEASRATFTTPPPTSDTHTGKGMGTPTAGRQAAYKQIAKLIKERLTAPDLSLEALQSLQKELHGEDGETKR
jgi:hypothetical protein